jgi:hypothetical protein
MKATSGGRARPAPLDDNLSGPSLYIPEAVIVEIERLLPTHGAGEAHEGVIYLGGAEVNDGAVALVALSPVAATTWGSFRTDVDANSAVVRALADLGASLVGQVHSHPSTWVDHSDGDDAGALVRFDGYWSLVVPSFARDGLRPIERCGIHLYQSGSFKRLTTRASRARVRVLPASIDLRGDP